MRTFPLTALALCMLASSAPAEPWPFWRGPRSDGTSLDANAPVHWSDTENIRWKTPIPGRGHSSPVVWAGRIFLTSCDERERTRLLLCVDKADGKLLWRRTVQRARLERKHKLNSYASSTPATDGKHVWVTFLQEPGNTVQVVCYGVDGKEVWRKSPGEFHSMHGYCSSLLLYKDLLILNADQDAVAYIVAFDKNTGREVWRIDRPNRVRSYCPPVVFDLAGRKQLVLSGSKCVSGYDPDTGKQLWLVDGPTEQFVASLVHAQGVLLCTGGFPTLHLVGIDPGGAGNVSATHVLWHERENPSYVPSPIAAGEWFFVISDKGVASCLQARTGKYLWSQQLGKHHSASAVSAGGRLYFLDDAGTTHVIKAAPRFELIARNPLGEDCFASPAISGGEILIRSMRHLWCVSPGK